MTTAVVAAEKFEKPWLLLCEGRSDERFFAALFQARKFGENYHVRSPYRAGQYEGGVTNFGADLANISVNQEFLDNVEAVLVVGDNDANMADAFKTVQAQLEACKFPVPTTERTIAKKAGLPHVVVLMLPMGATGNLESLCLESAYQKWGLKPPLDTFVANCPAKDWSIGKQAKMRMQAILAATNKDQPDAGFGAHWRQDAKFRIPLDHACFTGLVDFLKDRFPALIAA
jgi:hypothetical protein